MPELNHRQLIEGGLTVLVQSLAPWVDERMTASVGKDWLKQISAERRGAKVSLNDPQFVLKIVDDRWHEIFGKYLNQTHRSYIKLLRDLRNEWAHDTSRQFSTDEVYRTLDQIAIICDAISAPQADQVHDLKRAFLKRKDDRQVRDQTRLMVGDDEATAVTGLPAWRELIVPHTDVREGRLRQAEFAADLWEVYNGKGSDEYLDPVEFFRRTHPTEGLRSLLTWAAQRVSGGGGQPVIDLQTNFGGGKTHSLLALFHLFGDVDTASVQWLDDLIKDAGVGALPRARRAVLVGNKLQAGVPSEKPDGTMVHTMWGELAYQLGGPAAYALVKGADETGTNPGRALKDVFEMCAPCVVLIDEWVAYARQLYDRGGLAGGSFETQFTFAQTLTEEAKAVDGVCLVVSLPMSTRLDDDRETGGEAGRLALERIRNVVGRISTPWRPASKEEAYEIVRRRLFEPITDPALIKQRDALARAFVDYYKKNQADFPAGAGEPAYAERIRAAYPIHPDLFDRLYEDWSILPRFQRTRGVLRLMATVIASLWAANDRAPMIMAGGIPLTDPSVRNELQQMLEDRWDAVINEEVDGPDSRPAKIEKFKTRLGQRHVCRRLTRAIFVSSVPWWREDPSKAAREVRALRLSVALPGEAPALFGDALGDLSKELRNLYSDRAGYYFSLKTNLTALAEDRARDLEEHHIDAAIAARLKLETRGDRGPLAGGIQIDPAENGDVPDEKEVRLVILGMQHPYAKADGGAAETAARELILNGRAGPRRYRNGLLFLAAAERDIDSIRGAARAFLAWESLSVDADVLEMTSQQRETAAKRLKEESDSLTMRLREGYKHLLVPRQADPNDLNAVTFDVHGLSGTGTVAERAVKKITDTHVVQSRLGGTVLGLALRKMPRWSGDHIVIADLIEDLGQYMYLDLRVSSPKVILDAVADGANSVTWQTETFAYADAFADGRYIGLVTQAFPGVVNISGLIVRPDIAEAQRKADAEAEAAKKTPDATGTSPTTGAAGEQPGPDGAPAAQRPKRFHGSISLDPDRLVADTNKVLREILDHAPPGATIEATLDIEIRAADGFPPTAENIIRENANALKFNQADFETQ